MFTSESRDALRADSSVGRSRAAAAAGPRTSSRVAARRRLPGQGPPKDLRSFGTSDSNSDFRPAGVAASHSRLARPAGLALPPVTGGPNRGRAGPHGPRSRGSIPGVRAAVAPARRHAQHRGRVSPPSPDPAISAVLPTHQRAHLIGRALESVLAQTHAPREVVVVDDGSTDRTPDVLAGFGQRVRAIRQENRGASAARNTGVRAATSPWVAFLDSDDTWRPDHLARVADAIRETDGAASLYFANAAQPEDRGGGTHWGVGAFAPREPFELLENGAAWALLPRQPMLLPASVVRRDDWAELGGLWPELATREDTHFFLRLAVGRALCAVAGVGLDVSSDAGDERLTRSLPTRSRAYLEATARLYADVLDAGAWSPEQRRDLRRRLGRGLWNLAKHDARERNTLTAFRRTARALRADPALPARLVGIARGG